MSTTINDIAKLLKSDDKKGDTSFWGIVHSTIEDGEGNVTGYNVSLDGSANGAVKCNKVVGAKQGDQVLVTLRANGEAVVVATKGGDTDVQDVATNLDTNYYNKTETEQKIAEGGGTAVYTATCSTSAGTTAKVATCDGFTLKTGAVVNVSFTYANTASSPTLNVNNTGAKAIQLNGAAITSPYYWKANSSVQVYYNGTAWQLLVAAYFSDLMALAAQIGGMSIQNGSIYSGYHSSRQSSNPGSYLGTDGVSYVTYMGEEDGTVGVFIKKPYQTADTAFSVAEYYDGSWHSPTFEITTLGDITARNITSGDIDCGGIECTSLSVDESSVLTYGGLMVTDCAVNFGTIAAGGYKSTASYDFTTTGGYYPIGIVGQSSASKAMSSTMFIYSASTNAVTIRANCYNIGSSSVSNLTITYKVLWAKM